MAIILVDHFDNLNNWTNLTNATNPAGGISGNCLQVGTGVGQADFVYGTGSDTLDVTVWIKLSNIALANACMQFMTNSSTVFQTTIRTATDGTLNYMRGGIGGTILGSTPAGTIVNNTWTKLRVRAKCAESPNGTYDVWINDVNLISGTGDTHDPGLFIFDTVRLTNQSANTTFFQFDDITVDNGRPNVSGQSPFPQRRLRTRRTS